MPSCPNLLFGCIVRYVWSDIDLSASDYCVEEGCLAACSHHAPTNYLDASSGTFQTLHYLAQAVYTDYHVFFSPRSAPDCMRYGMDELSQAPVPGCLSDTACL